MITKDELRSRLIQQLSDEQMDHNKYKQLADDTKENFPRWSKYFKEIAHEEEIHHKWLEYILKELN